jgi:hypothetical protein
MLQFISIALKPIVVESKFEIKAIVPDGLSSSKPEIFVKIGNVKSAI